MGQAAHNFTTYIHINGHFNKLLAYLIHLHKVVELKILEFILKTILFASPVLWPTGSDWMVWAWTIADGLWFDPPHLDVITY